MTVAQGQFTIAELRDGTGAGGDVVFYLTTDRSAGVTAEDPGWSRTPRDMTAEEPYLWTYRLTAYALPGEEPTEEITGETAAFRAPCAAPLAGLAAAIAPPERDYHGYDAPWPAGGGKNVYDAVGNPIAQGNISSSSGGNSSSNAAYRVRCSDYTRVDPEAAYTISSNVEYAFVYFYNSEKEYLTHSAWQRTDAGHSFTTPQNAAYMRFVLAHTTASASGSNIEIAPADVEYVQIERGSQKTGWAPYENICPLTLRSGCTVTVTPEGGESAALAVTWQDEAGLLYAGTLDVTGGVLTVTQGGLVFDGTEGWGGVGSGNSHFFRLSVPGRIAASGSRGCSHFPNASVTTGNTAVGYYAYTAGSRQDGYLQLRPLDPGSRTTADWKAYLAAQAAAGTPVAVFWTWAEPKVYRLPPQELWVPEGAASAACDAGPVTVRFYRDAHATAPVLTGVFGRDGVGVLAVEQEFFVSPHGEALTAEEKESSLWSQELPSYGPGAYLWTRQKLTYTADGSTPCGVGYTEPYCLTAAVQDAAATELSAIRVTVDGVSYDLSQLEAQLLRVTEAVSDFGSFREAVESRLTADAESLTQTISYVSELRSDLENAAASFTAWRVASEGCIRSGIVDYDEQGAPVYGVAVGQKLETTVDAVTGETVVEKKNFRAVYAASRLAFWQDEVEVAYVSNNRLYITDVTALRSVAVGRWRMEDAGGLAFRWIGEEA